MDEKTLEQLKKISKPKIFKKDEYICHEGQPGNEMYIVLKGTIGVYITSALGNLTEVAQIKEGNFFGEMAIFDNEPRSASCIALEDCICVAVTKENLDLFLINCTKMAEKLLENMSSRIRKLNNDLYKSVQTHKKRTVEKFRIPKEYAFSHIVKEPFQDESYYDESIQSCPICGEKVVFKGIKKNVMQIHRLEADGRIKYLRCEPLWREVLQCQKCKYSNHYLKFFRINLSENEGIKKLLEEEHKPEIEKKSKVFKTKYDEIILRYLQAIHINERINQEDDIMIGTLWLNLYWLGVDGGDDKFTFYCAKNAIDRLTDALNGEQEIDEKSKCLLALSLGNLLVYVNRASEATKYCLMALSCKEDSVRDIAIRFRDKIM